MDDQHTKTWCCILATSNEPMTKKGTKNENRILQASNSWIWPTWWPTNIPKIEAMYQKHPTNDNIGKYKKIHSLVTHMSGTWLCWMNSTVQWCPTLDLDMISAKNCTKNKENNYITKGFVKVPWICSKWEIIYQWEISHAEFKLYTPYMQAVRTIIQFYCTWKSR